MKTLITVIPEVCKNSPPSFQRLNYIMELTVEFWQEDNYFFLAQRFLLFNNPQKRPPTAGGHLQVLIHSFLYTDSSHLSTVTNTRISYTIAAMPTKIFVTMH